MPVACNTCKQPIEFAGQNSDGSWIRTNPDGSPHIHPRGGGGGGRPGGRSPEERREMMRMSCLKSACDLVGQMSNTREEVKTEHVLPLADKFFAWVTQ